MKTLGEVVQELSDAGADTVLVRTGDENQYLRNGSLVVEAIHRRGDPETKTELLEVFDDAPDEVVWQGNDWILRRIVREETLNENEDEYVVVYTIDEKEVVFDELFERYREVWFSQLKELGVEDLKDDRRWKIRAREIDQETNLEKKESKIRALSEIGLSEDEISEVSGISKSVVEKMEEKLPKKLSEELVEKWGVKKDPNTDGEEVNEEASDGEERESEFRDYGNKLIGRRKIGDEYEVIHTYEIDSEAEVGEISMSVEYKADNETVGERRETQDVIDGKVITKNGKGDIRKVEVSEYCEERFVSDIDNDLEKIGSIILEQKSGRRYEKILEEL